MFSGPNEGIPPSLGTRNTCCELPGDVENKLPLRLPRITPLLAKLVDPVPPFATPSTPELMIEAGNFGISVASKVVALVTRPLLSTVSLVY